MLSIILGILQCLGVVLLGVTLPKITAKIIWKESIHEGIIFFFVIGCLLIVGRYFF